MSVWRIWNFDGPDTPHWDAAIIDAPDEDAALARLEAYLEAHEADDETVWNPRPRSEWKVRPFDGEFILGGGCR